MYLVKKTKRYIIRAEQYVSTIVYNFYKYVNIRHRRTQLYNFIDKKKKQQQLKTTT